MSKGNPYAPGGPYGPGSPYCGNCYPYGPGFPDDPNAPTNAECIIDTKDPCAKEPKQTTICPNGICDERFRNLPPTIRMRLFGVVDQCAYQFPHSEGFVVSDRRGQFITERPCIKIPFKRDFVRDPETGELVTDSNGDFVQGEVPRFDSIIVADDCGCQNRLQGIPGLRMQMIWDSNGFIFEQVEKRENNPLLDPLQVPIVDQGCPEILVAALIPSTEKVIDACGVEQIKTGFRISGVRNVGTPIGTMEMWPGASTNIPVGYFLCDGETLDRDDFPELFEVLGHAWGGAGSDFNLPDMRGLIPRGVDIGIGRDPDADDRVEVAPGGNVGDKVGSLQEDQMQCFQIEYDKYVHKKTNVKQSTAGSSKSVADNSDQYETTEIEFVDGGCDDPRFGNETRPKNVYVNFIIKAGCPPVVEE